MSALAVVLASVAVAAGPCPVSEPWLSGELEEAGRVASECLQAVDPSGPLLGDGAILAFIAGLAAEWREEWPATGYYFWVAANHERTCGRSLSRAAREATELRNDRPARDSRSDRLYASSPYLRMTDRTCGPAWLEGLDARSPEPGAGEAAVAFLMGRRGVSRMVYGYPSEEMAAVHERLRAEEDRGWMSRFGTTRIIRLDPCLSFLDRQGGVNEVCRPSADVTGG